MTRIVKRILVATDFSDGSDEALSTAIDLAKKTAASLQIVHVLEIGADQFPFGLASYDERSDLLGSIDRELARRADWGTREGVVCHTRIVEGSAAAEILKSAEEMGADLVVIGSHGRRGIARAVLGSVAERIVQRATCPVLTVPFSKKAA